MRFEIVHADSESGPIGTFEGVQGFFEPPGITYDERGVPEDGVPFTITGLRFRRAASIETLTQPEGFQINICNDNSYVIGQYNVSLATAGSVPGEPESVRLRGSVSPYPERGADVVWRRWAQSMPQRRGEWLSLPYDWRRPWLHVVALHAFASGTVAEKEGPFVLEGSGVIDETSFFIAMGEAVNGPGGYFGWNLDAFDDCLAGSFGAKPQFTLLWTDASERNGPSVRDRLAMVDEIMKDRGITVIYK